MDERERYLKQMQRRREGQRKRALLNFPKPGAKLRYRGAHRYSSTDIIENAERELRVGEIYTLRSIELFLSCAAITLEETGKTEYELGFFEEVSAAEPK